MQNLTSALVSLAFVLALGCLPSPYGLSQGAECELNSDCDAPLVCRIGYCRRECSTSRDCAAGLDCLTDNDGLGACQLPPETRCAINSDCTTPLACTMGECTNACGSCTVPGPCVDCPAGAMCVRDADGELGCFDPSTRTCVYSSDCAADMTSFVCAFDGRCRLECTMDEDCRFGDVCRERTFEEGGVPVMGRLCVLPGSDDAGAGTPDAGTDSP